MHQSPYSEFVAVVEVEVEVEVEIEVEALTTLGSSVCCEPLVGWLGLFVMFPSETSCCRDLCFVESEANTWSKTPEDEAMVVRQEAQEDDKTKVLGETQAGLHRTE